MEETEEVAQRLRRLDRRSLFEPAHQRQGTSLELQDIQEIYRRHKDDIKLGGECFREEKFLV